MKRRLTRIPLRIRVGKAIRQRRKAMELTQAEFASGIDMDRTYYALIESGRKNMQLDTLECVCWGLKVEPSEILATAEADKDSKGPPAKHKKGRRAAK